MIDKQTVSAAARKLADLVQAHSSGMAETDLVAEATRQFPRVPEQRLAKLVAEAVGGGLLTISADRILRASPSLQPHDHLRTPPTLSTVITTSGSSSGAHVLRVVALDIESVVRTTAAAPYTERDVYEVAAVRFGADREWVAADRRWQRYLEFPEADHWLRDDRVRKVVLEQGIPAEQAWAELGRFLADAEVVIAHNGTGLDFPVISAAAIRAGCEDPLAAVRTADSLYLTHALWPLATSHRLHDLARQFGVPLTGLRAHTAAGDATLLVRMMERAADELSMLRTGLRELIADVCPDSDAWRLLRELVDGERATERLPRVWEQAHVTHLLGAEFAQHPLRRDADQRSSGLGAVVVPDALRDADGRVDPTALARVVHGSRVEPRPAQRRMTKMLHEWTDRGISGLLEAPTGTGKSYAVLAVALDWLAGGDGRTAVVTTYTKQLQSQMARDLHDVERAMPGVLDVADLVKGQSNRLSLAALTRMLAEATRGRRLRRTRRGSARPLQEPRFRELAVYLALRMIAAKKPPQSWVARSVDPVDLPAFFAEYMGCGMRLWLESLSQRDGDYGPGAGNPLAGHTDTVREAISGHRLVLANHALILSHLDDLRAVGSEVLLVIDEAHELENAATSALTVAVDYQDLESVLRDHQAWLAEAFPDTEQERAASVAELDRLLDDERLPRLAAQAFDARAKGVGVRIGSRATALAGPCTGTSGTRDTRRLSLLLARIARTLSACRITLERYIDQHTSHIDVLAQERLLALALHTDHLAVALDRITGDIDAFLDPAVTLDDALPSRVIYMEELAAPRAELRSYRFRIATSPIDLPADPEWRRYLESFSRVHYISATLRVAGAWDFVRSRLGLLEHLPALALPSPFDLGNQAEVVCFADFPSWAEQEDGAIRTVAHQVACFAAESTYPRSDGQGFDGGGMILTTARSTAAGIGFHLVEELRSRGMEAPVVEALILGNGRAYQTFTDPQEGGGFLVGTKGLWQGVDVSDAERLRLVWINKLPFAPFAAPIVEARRAAVSERAARAGHPDPEGAATEQYYLPLAALQLRQAVGRLIRSDRHRGVVIISDRKLAGHSSLRRSYRKAFLGSLDEGLARLDPDTGESGAGNVTTMAEGWRRIWHFMADQGVIAPARATELCTDEALERHTLLPHTLSIRKLALTPVETSALREQGLLAEEVLARCARIGGLLRLSDDPVNLKPAQQAVIVAVTEGRNVLGLLPTGFGKSFTFQLPALVLPGVTVVVSPLVALMHDQALELNRSIGGAVRALVSPSRESNSRAGKTEVTDQLLGRAEHGIRLVYVSPERLCQRRFRETVRRAAQAGRLTRIAVDEAHTLAQWEDFRPSMRRVSRFLGELRRDYGVAVTAVTATANRAVHEALREGLFALLAEVPALGSAAANAEAESGVVGGLVTVRESPIRPELAIFRRSLDRLGQGSVAGLVERVVDALDGHAILYCLTVKEVNTLYTHLREYAGDTGVRVLRFHGRLTEAEKSAVMTEFREAPHQGDDDFLPIVVVATSAFGLGVNRPDIRTVMCVSPPTDLAALYQQIGRAGRDSTGLGAKAGGPVNSGLVLATSRGLRMVRFITGQEQTPALLRRMGTRVLAQREGTLDPARLAGILMAEDAASGVLSESELEDRHTQERYQGDVMRAFSALADLGAVEDHGDYPPYCAVKPGDLRLSSHGTTRVDERGDRYDAELERVEQTVIDTALRWDTPRKVDIRLLHEDLTAHCTGYREYADGPAAAWELLADLHDRGLLDVSAAPSRRLVTGLTIGPRTTLPDGYLPLLHRRGKRAAEELAALKHFFDANTVCAQRLLADYFGVTDLPEGCCGTARCRCSACWDSDRPSVDERRPDVATAFHSPRPRDGGRADTALRDKRVDLQIHRLLQLQPQGMHPRRVWHALRGDESSYNPRSRKMISLPAAVRNSRHFGGRAGLPFSALETSLARLAAGGVAIQDQHGLWRAVRPVRHTGSRA